MVHPLSRCYTRSPAPDQTAGVLKLRFDRDECADWKEEYLRRRTELEVAEEQAKVGTV